MPKIVEYVSKNKLLQIPQTGVPVYSRNESSFLSTNAPYSFGQRPLHELLDNAHAITDVNQIAVHMSPNLDVSIARPDADLTKLFDTKAEILNPILSAFSIDTVVMGDNPLSALYKLKRRSLDILRKTARFEDLGSYKREADCTDYQNEIIELSGLFGNVPIVLYGSTSNNRHSILNLIVFPKRFLQIHYQKIKDIYDPRRIHPMHVIIIPEGRIREWAFSDATYRLSQKNSEIISGELDIPYVSDAWINYLKIHHIANMYIKARKALTPQGLTKLGDTLSKINRILKTPIYVYLNLNHIYPGRAKTPAIDQFQVPPKKDELIRALVNANISLNKLLWAYRDVLQNIRPGL